MDSLIIGGVFLAFIIITLFLMVRQVPQGFNYTVERFRRYDRTLKPGLALVMPYIEIIGHKVNMMEQVFEVPTQEIITRDNATARVDGIVFFQILDAAAASYQVSDMGSSLTNLVMTNIRTVMGSMDLDQMLSHRDEINNKLLTVVDTAVSPWGVKVTRIEIKDIVPPANLTDSMARQMKAEREKRASVLEAEGARQSEVLRAEGHKQSQILEAEGRKESAFRDAEARERLAEAEARATEMVSNAIANGNLAAVNYLIAEKYVRALSELSKSPNQKIMILPMEAAGLAGALAGIGEIAKSALGDSNSQGTFGVARNQQSVGHNNSGMANSAAPAGSGPAAASNSSARTSANTGETARRKQPWAKGNA